MDFTTRTEALLGKGSTEKLNSKKVAVFGLGGVGGYAVEALVRAGIGSITLVDFDTVSVTNINRQIIATTKTIGKKKTDLTVKRVKEINPDINVSKLDIFYNEETQNLFDLSAFDYIVDAIDSVSSKVLLIKNALEKGVKIISSMGTGNKLDPTAFKVDDISKTSYCPLAKAVRRELKKVGITSGVKVVYSTEQREIEFDDDLEKKGKGIVPASVSFVPSVAGLIIGGQVILDLIKD